MRRLGAVVLAGTGVGAVRSVAGGLLERRDLVEIAEVVEPVGCALVVAAGVHLAATMPTGSLRNRTTRYVVVGTYVVAVLVGLWRWADEDLGTWPLYGLGALGVAVAVPEAHRRYVESRGVVRQRLQWVGLAASLVAETVLIVGTLHVLIDWPPAPGPTIGASLLLIALALIAGSSKRLVGRVESLLQHTVSLAGSSAIVFAIYLVVVVGLGRVPNDGERTILVLSMLAAAIAALVFSRPGAASVEIANRLVYGERNAPDEALRDLRQPHDPRRADGRAAAAAGRDAAQEAPAVSARRGVDRRRRLARARGVGARPGTAAR